MAETKCGFNDMPGGATGTSLLVAYGPTLMVNIGFDVRWKSNTKISPMPGLKNIQALVDSLACSYGIRRKKWKCCFVFMTKRVFIIHGS